MSESLKTDRPANLARFVDSLFLAALDGLDGRLVAFRHLLASHQNFR